MDAGRADRLALSPQAKPRRASFVLTPLIDVIFLLLIFFMLSSQISPYSLLPIGGVARDAGSGATASGVASDLSLRVAAGSVRIGAETIALGDLGPVLERLVRQGAGGFLVIATRSARVQDVVSVLEALQDASAERVTLVNAGGRPAP